MRKIVLTIGFLGAVIFGFGFFLSYAQPLLIESAARELIRIEVEMRMGQKIDSLSNSRLVGIARSMADKAQIDIQKVEQEIRDDLPRKVAQSVADMMKADCECRKRMIQFAEVATRERLATLTQLKERMEQLIEGTYSNVRDKLLHEFRIFCAANALVFLLLFAVAFFKRGASLQLLLPTAVLLGAAALTGSIYVLNQNWIHTMVFSDYVGFAYFGYLLVAVAFLSDVLLNRSRVSTVLVTVVASALGIAVSAVSC